MTQQVTLPPECQLDTDDLVVMIGESAVQKKQDNKIIKYLNELAAEQSAKLAEAESALEIMKKTTATASESQKSIQDRIASLEDQVHRVALERDAALKEARNFKSWVDGLNATISGLQAQLETKGKKKGKKS